MKKLLFILFIILLGCKAKEIIPKENGKIDVIFCPEENCSSELIKLINSANIAIHCAFYNLNLKDIIYGLANKSKNIDVKIIIDDKNYNKNIKGVRIDKKNHKMHNKFCVIDYKKVWTGSFNPTIRDNYYNNNDVIILESKYIAENYEAEFLELWHHIFSDGNKVKYPVIFLNNTKVENYFCPEDCTTALNRIVALIKDADKTIYFMTFSFTSEDIADALLLNNKAKIKGIFERSQINKYSQYKRLKDFGLNVKLDTNPANMHHKVFIIDNVTVITGSFNPTKSAITRNDENILIIHSKDIATEYIKEFEKLWYGNSTSKTFK